MIGRAHVSKKIKIRVAFIDFEQRQSLTCISKKVFVKEDGGEGDEEQEDGGEVGGHQLCDHLPLQLKDHVHHISVLCFDEGQVCYCEHGQVSVITIQIPESLWLTQLV